MNYDNPLVYGKSQTPNIVSAQVLNRDGKCGIRYYIREGDDVFHEDVPWFPYCWVNDPQMFAGLKDVTIKRFRGNLHYNNFCYTDSVDTWKAMKSRINMVKEKHFTEPSYIVRNGVQSWLMQSGNTLFKGMEFDDVVRGQLDIETYGKEHFARAENPDDKIIIVVMSDNRGHEVCIHTKETMKDFGDYRTSEAEMIDRIGYYIHMWNWDVIELHNGYKYDLPYIKERAKRNGVELRWGRDHGTPWGYPMEFRTAERTYSYETFQVNGRHIIDTMFSAMTYDVFKRDLPSYGLKQVAKYFGFDKQDRTYVEGDEIWRYWDENPEPLLKYALDDVYETRMISEKLNGSTFYTTPIIPMSYEDVARRGTGGKIESLFVREYLRQQHSLPFPGTVPPFQGARTEVFMTGVVGPIVHADVESLYPSCQLTFNIFPKSDVLGIARELLMSLKDLRFLWKNEMRGHEKGSPEFVKWEGQQASAKVIINCFDDETKMLTIDGIKDVKDVNVGDLVYSLNPDTLNVEIKPVTRTYEYDYDGPMVHVKSEVIDFKTTPNHRYLWADEKKDDYYFSEVENILNVDTTVRKKLPPLTEIPGKFQRTVNILDTVNLPFDVEIIDGFVRELKRTPGRKGKLQPFEFDTNLLMMLMGWFVSEGNLYKSKHKKYDNGNSRGVSYRIQICQTSEKYKGEIRYLLESMGIQFGEVKTGFWFCSRVLYEWFEQNCGKGSYNKRIPNWVFELAPKHLHCLIDAMMKGDGDQRYSRYTTASDELRDGFVRLCNHLGIRTGLNSSDGSYRLQFSRMRGGEHTIKSDKHVSVEPYSGKIFCVEVKDNHTVLAGRNLRFNWIGQSNYGTLGDNNFQFNDAEAAASVTDHGRTILGDMVKYVQERGGLIVEIDTDGIYFIPPPEVVGEEAERAFVDGMTATQPEGIVIGFDGRYKKMMSLKAKNYMLMDYNDKISMKGSSLKSRGMEPVFKKFVKDGFVEIMKGGIPQLRAHYTKLREDIINKRIPVEDLAKSSSLTKSLAEYEWDVVNKPRVNRQAHYEVAKKLNEVYKLDIDKGSKVTYYISGNSLVSKDTKNFVLAKPLREYDNDENISHYLERLDKVAEKFLPMFEGKDFRDVFLAQPSLFDTNYEEIETVTRYLK